MNKIIDFIDLPSIFYDKSVTSSIPASEPPFICYKYKNINIIFHFNKLVSDIDIDANTPDSWESKYSKFIYPSVGHVVTGNLKIIPASRICFWGS